MIAQAVQLLGAFMILGAFAGLQLGRLRVDDMRYLWLNAVGSGVLLIVAVLDREWGFILLEATWACVALIGIARLTHATPSGSGLE